MHEISINELAKEWLLQTVLNNKISGSGRNNVEGAEGTRSKSLFGTISAQLRGVLKNRYYRRCSLSRLYIMAAKSALCQHLIKLNYQTEFPTVIIASVSGSTKMEQLMEYCSLSNMQWFFCSILLVVCVLYQWEGKVECLKQVQFIFRNFFIFNHS